MHAFTVMFYALHPKSMNAITVEFSLVYGRFHHFSSLNYLWLTLMRVAIEKSICLPNRSLKALVIKSIKTPSA
jgi:hypothetical protein